MSQGLDLGSFLRFNNWCREKRMRALLASNPLRDISASDAPNARQAPTGNSRPGPCC